MPTDRAASRIVDPAGTATGAPSMLSSTVGTSGAGGASGTRDGRAGSSV